MRRTMESAVISFFFFFFIFVDGDTDPAQASALKDLYYFLSSRDQLTNWNANDPCRDGWKGVVCHDESITELNLAGIGLGGALGYHLDSLTSLNILDLSNNHIGGQIPYSLPPMVKKINLSGNNFSQSLPYSIGSLAALEYLNLSHNQFQTLDDMFGKLSLLSTLDLSFNSLTGDLPSSFALLNGTTIMFLQDNLFTGTLNLLTNLSLQKLNVSNNHFSGWVPLPLQNIDIQTDGNNWNTGPAPPPPPGTPSYRKANKRRGSNANSSSGGGRKAAISIGGVAAIIISALLLGSILAFFLIRRRSKRSSNIQKFDNQQFGTFSTINVQEMKPVQTPPIVTTKEPDHPMAVNSIPKYRDDSGLVEGEDFLNKSGSVERDITVPLDVMSYSIADLQLATCSFNVDCLIGEGSFGRVYQAQFDNGEVLAVKKIDSLALPSYLSDDFMNIISKISHLHHPNVTELVGYCSEYGQHLLVYEFHKNGSLHDILHSSDEQNKSLEWQSRIKIALGAARALEYLHEVCSPPIVHKNFKSSNILLDIELNPHLSDCGLASYLPNTDKMLAHNSSSGCCGPEVAMSGQYTLKSDIYSFGVVMLELLSGRLPFDRSRQRSEQLLVEWAAPQLHDIDALTKMVDPQLDGLYSIKSLSRFADIIALCIQPEPEFRPPMTEVVEEMVRMVERDANMSRRTVGASERGSPLGRSSSLDPSF